MQCHACDIFLAENSALQRFEFIEDSSRMSTIELSNEFMEFLQIPDQSAAWENLLEKDRGDVFETNDFAVSQDELSTIQELLSSKSPWQIFFYGAAGQVSPSLPEALQNQPVKNFTLFGPATGAIRSSGKLHSSRRFAKRMQMPSTVSMKQTVF